ncbi:MAG: hypothetical protein ABJH06_17550 [Paraglaciecola sp.]|uniref:hypothetical protein n=1 Tax=Paraglaciecola sp. TaxID=1920173 RepID=UPI003298A75B
MDNSNNKASVHDILRSQKVMLYLVISSLMLTLILMGFLPSVYDAIIGISEVNLLIHSHAILFLSWIFFYTLQAILPALGKIEQHKKLGKLGLPLAITLTINGLYVTYDRFSLRVENEQLESARYFLLQPLTDMVVFPALVIAAFYYRNKSEVHKRLMLLATLFLTIAAVVRIPYFPVPGSKLLLWLSPIVLAMVFDYHKKNIIHPTYIFGLVLFTIVYARKPLILDTPAWQSFVNKMIALVQ